jgi:hypothetical protein
LTDVIESIAGIQNADLLNITHAQSKHIAYFDAMTGCLQLDLFDLASRLAGKAVRHQRRKVDTLIGPLAKRQCQRLHGSNSRRW